MSRLYENKPDIERVALVSVDTGEFDCDSSLDELEQLCLTAGALVVLRLVQKRDKPDGAVFLGEGKLLELERACEAEEITLIVCDCALTPTQIRNIEHCTGVRVIDRTMLILDIFALRARTSEGKLQVELAQLKYTLPRLTGKGGEMSRLAGGIGTRGPGETQLETDRRHIRRRILSLEQQLENIARRRKLIRSRRKKNRVTTVAVVGYTNAGKSTLLNALTGAGVLCEDKLFATLDPTARKLRLPDGPSVLLVDTVGFISRLPHELVSAFKSTLEEAVFADLILNVVDASNPDYAEHISVTLDVLEQLGAGAKPVITVYNKCDLNPNLYFFGEKGKSVRISALKGLGLDKLLEAIGGALEFMRREVTLMVPYSHGSVIAGIRRNSMLLGEEYTPDGVIIRAILDVNYLDGVKEYIVSDNPCQ